MSMICRPIATSLPRNEIAAKAEAWRDKLGQGVFADATEVAERLGRVERYGQAGPKAERYQMVSWTDGDFTFYPYDPATSGEAHAIHRSLALSVAHAILHRPMVTGMGRRDDVMVVPTAMHAAEAVASDLGRACDPAIEALWFALAFFLPEKRIADRGVYQPFGDAWRKLAVAGTILNGGQAA